MKQVILIMMVVAPFTIKTQTDSICMRHRNEIGADVTVLMTLDRYVSTPTYILTYRYYVDHSNIRFAVGGSFSKTTAPFSTIDSSKTIYDMQNQFAFRIGYEFVAEITKRWQIFYGLDIRPTFYKTEIYGRSNFPGYIDGNKTNTTTYGIAPLLGFRFRISSRVSLTTETGFSYNIQNTTQRITFIPIDPLHTPKLPDYVAKKVQDLTASFTQPLFLIFTVNL